MLPLPFRMLFKYRPFLLLPLLSFAANLPDPPRLRLGDNVRPVHYAIDLTLAPDQDTFEGKADIDVSVGAPSSLIWLNATQIEIRQAAFEAAGATMPATVVAGGDNFIGLQLTKPVSGAGALHLAYTGKISRNSSAGLFQMKESGRWYVYSQFEPTDARRAFPSFDEPGFKVPWQLTLHVPAEDMALSNTPVESETPASGGLKTVRFAQTKPLPSYLVALAVGPFDAVSAGKVGRAPLRIIVPHGRGSEAKFAVEAVPALLKLLEDYFGSPYPYEKLDSVVMPIANFAMENVGLITYPESLLLGNPQTDSSERRRECAITVAHEMAHQWFGDLVTTAWWDDIWLNEAFATWMETKMVGEWKPEWKADVGAVESKLGAMNLDSLISARRIRQPIRTDNDIANAFDGITYEKGAAVIRMFENWIGSDKFRKGTRLYLKQHANGNATTADFEAAISTAAGKDIAPAFNSFLDQPGVPELTVALDCSAKKPRLTMSQKRSLPIGSPGSAPQTWQIPVCVKYAGGGDKQECTLVADPRSDIVLNHAHGCPAWLLANNKEIGYYRVNYQNGLLAQLLKQSAEELSVPERAGILGDLKALVDSGDVSPKLALSFVPQFGRENERHIVAGALSIAELLTSDSVPAELRPKGAAFIREVFGPHASELGWKPREDDDDNTRLLRETLVPEVASEGEQKQLITEAERLARHWIEDRKSLTPDMAPRVLSVAAEFGNRDLFDRLHAAALKEKNQRTREVLVGSLSEFRNREIAQAALDLLLSNDFDIRESFWNLFGPLAYPETRDLPFRWVQQHLDELLKRLPREVGEDFAADLPSVGKRFCDADKRAEVEAFFKDRVKDYVGGPRTLAKTLESIDLCMARKKVLGPELAAFLETRPD
jgi:alanyl aminopeptidase